MFPIEAFNYLPEASRVLVVGGSGCYDAYEIMKKRVTQGIWVAEEWGKGKADHARTIMAEFGKAVTFVGGKLPRSLDSLASLRFDWVYIQNSAHGIDKIIIPLIMPLCLENGLIMFNSSTVIEDIVKPMINIGLRLVISNSIFTIVRVMPVTEENAYLFYGK